MQIDSNSADQANPRSPQSPGTKEFVRVARERERVAEEREHIAEE
jgi:hypothetical protein